MAGLLAVACLLHVLGGAARAGLVEQSINYLNGGGCSRCHLDQMVKDCPLDVEFVLDMSDSVSPRDYQRAREYVARQMIAVVDAFQGTQVGFLAFSNIVYTDIAIQPRSPQELQGLTRLVQTLAQQRYGTQLAGALRRARQVLAAHNGTTLVPGGQRGKLIVLVSDGCQDNDRAVKKEAIQAHLDGISIVSVQLYDTYLDLLKAISIQVLELRTDIDWSSVVACPARILPIITARVCGDIVIAMDGSDSVRRWEKVMRDYLAYTAMRYSYQTNAMGVIVFGTNVTSQSSDTMIKPKRDKLQLAEEIEKKLSFPNERGTGTTQAIREATAFLRELALTGVPNLKRTLVVITDGPALHPQSARLALDNANSEGFKVVVIGVGDTLTAAELQRMAGQQSFVVRVNSYLDLFAVDLSDQICGRQLLCTNVCPPKSYPNPNDNCTCECTNVCPPNKVPNPNDHCACVCRDPCPFQDMVQDPASCICRPIPPPCPPGKIRDVITGICICNPNIHRCNSLQRRNESNCQCECVNRCLSCQIQDHDTCLCGCNPNIRCTGSQVLNRTSCKCECSPDIWCNLPHRVDPDTCQCGCNPDIHCNDWQTLNQNTCQCECKTHCLPCQIQDHDTCQCRCPDIMCTGSQVLNQANCKCECEADLCPLLGGVQDPNTCQCVPGPCPAGKIRDVITGQCKCLNPCPPGTNQDPTTCQCVPGPCPPGQIRNVITGLCECTNVCPPKKVPNPNAQCACVCRNQCLFPDPYQDPVSCICGKILCPNTCPSNKRHTDTCDCECRTTLSCGPNQIFNPNTCACEPTFTPTPGPPRKCSPSKYRCQNNQPATEDCKGRCICHCDTSLYAGFYCDLPVRPSLCDNCTFTNGHYLAGVEGRCDLFVVCQPTGNGGYLPHIRDCPSGTIFKQTGTIGRALCDYPSSSGSCPTDPCRRLPAFAKYPDSRNCNHYWQCDANGRTASSGCCPPGQGFDRAQAACAPDSNCPNDCDPNFKSCRQGNDLVNIADSCPYEALASDPKKFFNPKAPGLYQTCAPSDIFNETLCRCVKNPYGGCTPNYDINFDDLDQDTNGFKNVEIRSSASLGANGNAGCFGGNSRIILYRFSDSGYNLDYFEVSLRVRLENLNLRPGQEMAIVSNGDCGGDETLAITVDGQYMYFKVKSSGGNQVHIVKVPYSAIFNGWLDIKFQYERKGTSKFYLMTGTVDGQSESVTLIGVIGHTKCALQLGHGQASSNLTACVDDFKVWKCKL